MRRLVTRLGDGLVVLLTTALLVLVLLVAPDILGDGDE